MIYRDTVKYMSLAVLIILISACDVTQKKQQQLISAASKTTASKAIAAAKAANKRAITEKYEWRDTRKIIKRAEQSLAKGYASKAITLANKARRQAENAVKQKYYELKRLEHMLGTTSK